LIELGRYGAFILPAFAVSAAGFAWMIWDSLAAARRWRREVARLEKARLEASQKGGAG
jgi:heme exporter protein D